MLRLAGRDKWRDGTSQDWKLDALQVRVSRGGKALTLVSLCARDEPQRGEAEGFAHLRRVQLRFRPWTPAYVGGDRRDASDNHGLML